MRNFTIFELVNQGLTKNVKELIESGKVSVNHWKSVETSSSPYREWSSPAEYTHGPSLLMYAVAAGWQDIVEYLIEKGADVNYVAGDGIGNALTYAKRFNPDFIELLKAAGCKDIDKEEITPNYCGWVDNRFGRGTEIIKEYAIARQEFEDVKEGYKAYVKAEENRWNLVQKIENYLIKRAGAKDAEELIENPEKYADKFSDEERWLITNLNKLDVTSLLTGKTSKIQKIGSVRCLGKVCISGVGEPLEWKETELSKWLEEELNFKFNHTEPLIFSSWRWTDWRVNTEDDIYSWKQENLSPHYRDGELTTAFRKGKEAKDKLDWYEANFPFVKDAVANKTSEELGVIKVKSWGDSFYYSFKQIF